MRVLYRLDNQNRHVYQLTPKERKTFEKYNNGCSQTIITKIEGKPVACPILGTMNGEMVFDYE